MIEVENQLNREQKVLSQQETALLSEKSQLQEMFANLSDRLTIINNELCQIDIRQSKLNYLFSECDRIKSDSGQIVKGLREYQGS